MARNNKVAWAEGMFLRTQHFQQADRYVETLVRHRVEGLRPHPWGLTSLAINRDMLKTGCFAVTSARGVLPDGTPFSIPDDADHPPPLEIPSDARNVVVHLTLPVSQPGGREMALSTGSEMAVRYVSTSYEAPDANVGSDMTARLQVGRMALRYVLETADRSGRTGFGLARIVEAQADRNVILDEGYIPPCLTCAASANLKGFLTELQGLFSHRAEAFAHRIVGTTATSGKSGGEMFDFLVLMLVNRYAPLFQHHAALADIHPHDFYALTLQAAGELATFTNTKARRPPRFPAYQHDDLQRTFAPVIAELRESLSAVIEQTAIPIPLKDRGYGIRGGVIKDRSLLTGATFVLAVRAQMPPEQLRRQLPSQIKIGAVEVIRELVTNALVGIPVTPLQVAPRQLPFHGGTTYFELNRTSEFWEQLKVSGGLAIHLSGDFPNVEMECWAIRE